MGHTRLRAVTAVAVDTALLLVCCGVAWQVAPLRQVIGCASSDVFLVVESWLNYRADASKRGCAFGAYLVASGGASAAGPLAQNVVPASPMLLVMVGMAFATAVLPVAVTRQPNPEVRPQAARPPSPCSSPPR